MQIEQLSFNIPYQLQSDFLTLDDQIWTEFFVKFEFYLGKEVWTNSEDPDFVAIIIRWRSLKEWKSIRFIELQRKQEEFDQNCQQKFGQKFKIQSSNSYKLYAPKIL
jgi:uncharacterized protein (TIGR03792 family)